jgi:phosphoribosylformylglycinamidine cyclo-ligase
MDYKDSGVDRDQAQEFVEQIKTKTKRTRRDGVLGDLGDFGGFFEAPKGYRDPVWVATTDGVGTKLLIAEKMAEKIHEKAHQAVGQDVVAMCVNDLIACGAEPLVFLDYLATGKIENKDLQALIDGIVSACDESNCALIGGETAEMPGFYSNGRYDVSGFSIGVVERDKRFNKRFVKPGDIIFGFESQGFHSNGFSMVRKVIEKQGWKLSDEIEGQTLGEYLIQPTKLYVRDILDILKTVKVRGAAHITGGGLIENLPRAFPEGVQVSLSRKNIPVPAMMKRFVEAGDITEKEAFSTWNMGIGFCLIVDAQDKERLLQLGYNAIELGVIEEKSDPSTDIVTMVD